MVKKRVLLLSIVEACVFVSISQAACQVCSITTSQILKLMNQGRLMILKHDMNAAKPCRKPKNIEVMTKLIQALFKNEMCWELTQDDWSLYQKHLPSTTGKQRHVAQGISYCLWRKSGYYKQTFCQKDRRERLHTCGMQ